MRQQQQFGQQSKAIIFLILFAAHRDANGVEQTQLNVQHAARTGTADVGAGAAPANDNAPGTIASVPTDAGMPYGNANAIANDDRRG
uniref:Secreted protein n=1 Tax=Globodera pallida TaxID=36090 RepID=A0A183BW15_GLOPA